MSTLANVISPHLGAMYRDLLANEATFTERVELRLVTDLYGGERHHSTHNRWQTECHRGDHTQSLH